MNLLHTSIVLAVHDLETEAKFYADILGCECTYDDGNWTFLTRDKFRVMLGRCPDALLASETGDHSYVAYVTVDDVDDLHAEVVTRGGAAFAPAPETKPWGMREFCLRSPEGHRIMFGQDVE